MLYYYSYGRFFFSIFLGLCSKFRGLCNKFCGVCSKFRAEQVSLQEMDVERLAFPDGAFDTVLDSYSLCVFSNPVTAVCQLVHICVCQLIHICVCPWPAFSSTTPCARSEESERERERGGDREGRRPREREREIERGSSTLSSTPTRSASSPTPSPRYDPSYPRLTNNHIILSKRIIISTSYLNTYPHLRYVNSSTFASSLILLLRYFSLLLAALL